MGWYPFTERDASVCSLRDIPPLCVPAMRLTPLNTRRGLPLRDAATTRTNPRNSAATLDRVAPWYTIRNQATTDGGRAMIDIYGEIGFWGVEASTFLADLRQLNADALEIHLNSPGGDVYDGLAIYQALVDHPARIEMRVDGLAASIASVIAQAGDRIIMGANAEMMIHDAWGLTVGNAADHRRSADDLDRVSNNLAAVYATRSGTGTPDTWREAMTAETWFSAQEAVDAGLADEVANPGKRGDPPAALWRAELAACRYLGRAAAPTPTIGGTARPAATTAPVESAPDPSADPVPTPVDEPGAVEQPGPVTAAAISPSPDPATPDPTPAPEPEADGVSASAVLAIIAAHHPDPPAPLVDPDLATEAVARHAATIAPDPIRTAEWVLAATVDAATHIAVTDEPPTADPTDHLDTIRRNFLEVMLP